MGEKLFLKWLDEDVEDLQTALVMWGVAGLLERFEEWLKIGGHIVENKPSFNPNKHLSVRHEIIPNPNSRR